VELGIDAGFKCLEAVPVEMSGLVEFDGNSTDPEIPPSNVVREVVKHAIQFVDPLDFAPEVAGLDVLPSQARTKLKNRVSGVHEEPGQVVLALSQHALPSGCRSLAFHRRCVATTANNLTPLCEKGSTGAREAKAALIDGHKGGYVLLNGA
jgi:hypothetical protein